MGIFSPEFAPYREHVNTGGGGIGLTLNDQNKLRDGTKGVHLVANWDQMEDVFNERMPVSVRVGVYWRMHPITSAHPNGDRKSRAMFEHIDNAVNLRTTRFIKIYEYFTTSFNPNLDVFIDLPANPPIRQGYVLGNSILVGIFDRKNFELTLDSYRKYIEERDPGTTLLEYAYSQYQFAVKREGTDNNYRRVRIYQHG